ncbi:MAG: sigma factor [Actinomycetota bacterium]
MPSRGRGPARLHAIFAEEHRALFRALYFVTGDRGDAQELMQEAFLTLWER